MTVVDVAARPPCCFDPDQDDLPATALQVDVDQHVLEQVEHSHRKGQLVVALHGGITCEVPGTMWMAPPQHGVWIPAGMPHSNRTTGNARLCFLFVEVGAAPMPSTCCTLALSPLVREMIVYLAAQGPSYPRSGPVARIAAVLMEQLAIAPVQNMHLPVSSHPRIRRMTATLTTEPADRRTLAQWAARLAMSERSLARLVLRETGLTFGRWRRQLHLIIALRQLAEGAAVQQVAANLGYVSVTAFITMFKKALGQPPAQYLVALR